MWKAIRRDLNRTIMIALIGVLMIIGAEHLPKVNAGAFSFAPAMTYLGGGFIAASATHILRRLLFPGFDLGAHMRKAFESPVGAGLVAVGVCYVIGQIYPTIANLFVK